HEPLGGDDDVAQEFAVAVAGHVRALLGDPGAELPLPVDSARPPEGRNGPMVRSLASHAQYYERWAEPWEQQALLRARPVAGDEGLLERFCALIDPYRYPADGLDDRGVRELRRVKARVESERMPRGVPANRQLKLGRGGLADAEWTAQLLQLQHAGRVPELRTARTVDALHAAREAGGLGRSDAGRRVTGWTSCRTTPSSSPPSPGCSATARGRPPTWRRTTCGRRGGPGPSWSGCSSAERRSAPLDEAAGVAHQLVEHREVDVVSGGEGDARRPDLRPAEPLTVGLGE